MTSCAGIREIPNSTTCETHLVATAVFDRCAWGDFGLSRSILLPRGKNWKEESFLSRDSRYRVAYTTGHDVISTVSHRSMALRPCATWTDANGSALPASIADMAFRHD
jgi:hypothetical protein